MQLLRPVEPTQNVSSLPHQDEDFFDVRAYYRIFWRRKDVIIGTVGLGLALTIAYLLLATPLYTATTEIIIDTRKQNVIEGGVLSGLDADAATIASELKVIKSVGIARRVIKKLQLDRDPEFGGQASGSASTKLFTTIFNSLFGLSAKEDASAVEAPKEVNEDLLDKQAVGFSQKIAARRAGVAKVISISFTSKDREKAAKITNAVADAYLVDQLEAKFEATRRANEWLRTRLRDLQSKLQESEKAVELYRAKHNLVEGGGKTPFEKQLDKLNEELVLARVKMKEKIVSLERVDEVQKSKGKLSSIDVVAQSEVVQKITAQLSVLAQREAELTTRFTGQHPKVLNVRAERRDLLRQREVEARRIIDNLKNDIEIAKKRVSSIENSVQDIKEKTKGAMSSSIGLRELEREANANRAIYESFLNRFKETSQQETLQTTDSRVITPAIPPRFASSPKKRRTLLFAIVGFLALGIGFAVLLEKLDNSFKTAEQVEEVLKIGHLASVPKLTAKDLKEKGKTIAIDRYILAKPLSAYAEAIRSLKVAVQLSNVDAPPKIILFTSSLPNEGKTSICVNLARHTAQTGNRTLLIDADLRNPSLTRKLAREAGAGLVGLLSRQCNVEQAIVRDQSGFDFLPTTQVLQNSAEILGSHSMKNLLQQFRQAYDYVIIDTSPVTPVIDARVLVDDVDSVVLVIEWDKTSREFVAGAIKALNTQGNSKLAGTVLNKMDMKRMASYSGYGYGTYYKTYPHYYGTTE